MSITNKQKMLIVAVVIVLIIAGVWYAVTGTPNQSAIVTPNGSQQSTTVASTSAENGLTTAPNNVSNSAIVQDVNSVNSQMQGLSSDQAAVNQSMQASSF